MGFGALLEQVGDDGEKCPIAYASHQTNPAERKYAPTESEVAALVYAVEHFEVYLLGNQVTVYMDHQALVSAFLTHLESRTRGLLARWYLRLSRFLPKLRLQYKPGHTNTVADDLSRFPSKGEVFFICESHKSDTELGIAQKQQKNDEDINQLITYLDCKELSIDPHDKDRVLSQGHKGYYQVNGVLYFEAADVSGRRWLVVPQHLRQQVLDENHESVFVKHFAAKKLLSKLSLMYYCPGMRADVYCKCESCIVCASVQRLRRIDYPPPKNNPVGRPFECIGMDFKKMDVSRYGNRYALVFQDYLSKWPEVYPVSDRTAQTVACCLADLVWRHGVPAKIIFMIVQQSFFQMCFKNSTDTRN